MTETVHQYEKSSLRLKLKDIVLNNFIGGASWALGATIGLSVIIALLTLIAHSVNFNLIPVVGSFASKVIDFVITNNQNLRK